MTQKQGFSLQLIPNIIQIVGWYYVIFETLKQVAKNPHKLDYSQGNPFGHALYIMRIMQTAEITDLFFSSGSLFSVGLQYVARTYVAWCFLNENTSTLGLLVVILAWGFADTIRYLFYVSKNGLITYLRYNAFLVLYPVGVFLGEIVCVYQYIKFYEQGKYPQFLYYGAIVTIGLLAAGLPFLYTYLLKARSRYYRKLKEGTPKENKTIDQTTENKAVESPQKKETHKKRD